MGSKASIHGCVSPVSAGQAPTHEAASFLSSVACPLGDAGIFCIRLISNLWLLISKVVVVVVGVGHRIMSGQFCLFSF